MTRYRIVRRLVLWLILVGLLVVWTKRQERKRVSVNGARRTADESYRSWTDIPEPRRTPVKPLPIAPRLSDGTAAGAPAAASTAAAPVAASEPTHGAPSAPPGLPGEVILSFYDNRDRDRFVKEARARGMEILDVADFAHAVRVRVSPDRRAALERLLDDPLPLARSPNFPVFVPAPDVPQPVPSDTNYRGFGQQALEWMGVGGDRADWGKGVTVAVLDESIQPHASLDERRIVRLVFDGEEAEVEDGKLGHGTAVASLIAGRLPGAAGVAPSANLLNIQVISGEGGDTFTLAKAIVEAVDRGAKIVNLCVTTRGDSFLLRQAVEYAQNRGAVVVAAAGNEGLEGVSYPARYPGVLAVAAVDAEGRHPHFSNRGDEIGLAAPGIEVSAAWPGERLVAFSGTSASVPLVSGALAALLSSDASLSPAQAAEILRRTARDVGEPGRDPDFGCGIVEVSRALKAGVKGIYDAAVGSHLRKPAVPDGPALLLLYVQNRGTERLPAVGFHAVVDDVPFETVLRDIEPGQTVTAREFVIDPRRLDGGKTIPVRCSVSLRGLSDDTPWNNAAVLTIGRW